MKPCCGKEGAGKHRVVIITWCILFLLPIFSYMTIAFSGGDTFLFKDGLLYSFPLRVFLHNAFAHGFSPQWMPYSACGFSLLAEGQSGLCFPATQIIYRLFPAHSGWLIEMITGQLVGFMGCYLLLRHIRLGTFACLFGASVYAFCIFAMFVPYVSSLMWCYSLLPAILCACGRFLQGRPRSSLECILAISLLFLTGHPVMIIYNGMIIAAFVLYIAITPSPTKKGFTAAGFCFLALVGLTAIAILIALPQWLPMFEQYRFSARTVLPESSLDALQNTLHLDLSWIPLSLFPIPPDSTGQQFFSSIIRFPVYAVFLAMTGVFFGKRRLYYWYFVCLFVFIMLMASGPYVGLWKLVHSLPVLKNFRFPFRWLSFLPLCVSVFSAMGLDRLVKQTTINSENRFQWVLRCLLLGMVIIEIVIVLQHPGKYLSCARSGFQTRPWLTIVLWASALGMALAAFWATKQRVNTRAIAVGVGLALVSLCTTRIFYFYDPGVLLNLNEIGFKPGILHTEPRPYRVASAMLPYTAWESGQINKYCSYAPNLSLLEGRLNAGYYCSFIPYWAADMSIGCQNALNGREEYSNILNICSVKQFAIPDPPQSRQPTAIKESVAIREIENPKATPRVNVVNSYVFCNNEEELVSVLKSSTFDSGKTVALLAQDRSHVNSSPETITPRTETFVPEATLLTDKSDYIEIELKSATLGESFLVLGDTYYPGWRVFVDGDEKDLLRANYAFRGVRLPEGSKHVVFTFDPLVPDFVLILPTIILIALGVLGTVLYMAHFDLNCNASG